MKHCKNLLIYGSVFLLVIFLLLPVVEDSFVTQKTGKAASPQISTENPFIQIMERISSFFGPMKAPQVQDGLTTTAKDAPVSTRRRFVKEVERRLGSVLTNDLYEPMESGMFDQAVYFQPNSPSGKDAPPALSDLEKQLLAAQKNRPDIHGKGIYEASYLEEVAESIRKQMDAKMQTAEGKISYHASVPALLASAKTTAGSGKTAAAPAASADGQNPFSISNVYYSPFMGRPTAGTPGNTRPSSQGTRMSRGASGNVDLGGMYTAGGVSMSDALSNMLYKGSLAQIGLSKHREILDSEEGRKITADYAERVLNEAYEKASQALEQEIAKEAENEEITYFNIKEDYACLANCFDGKSSDEEAMAAGIKLIKSKLHMLSLSEKEFDAMDEKGKKKLIEDNKIQYYPILRLNPEDYKDLPEDKPERVCAEKECYAMFSGDQGIPGFRDTAVKAAGVLESPKNAKFTATVLDEDVNMDFYDLRIATKDQALNIVNGLIPNEMEGKNVRLVLINQADAKEFVENTNATGINTLAVGKDGITRQIEKEQKENELSQTLLNKVVQQNQLLGKEIPGAKEAAEEDFGQKIAQLTEEKDPDGETQNATQTNMITKAAGDIALANAEFNIK